MKAVSYDEAQSYCANNDSVLTSIFDDFDFAFIARTFFQNQYNMTPANMTHFDNTYMIQNGTESQAFWTSIKVFLSKFFEW